MSRPIILDYLKTKSIADLFAEHGVRLSPSPQRPYKASANYDQINARDDDLLACECRGLVLATADGSPIPTDGPVGSLMVLARPMDRFFNFGQSAAHPVADDDLHHPDARVMEKVDGTLCIVYHDPFAESWCVATRSVPDADREVDGFGDHTFRSLFEVAVAEHLGHTWETFARLLMRGMTYCFELTSPRAGSGVVRYDDHRLHLLAVRSIDDGTEHDPADFMGRFPPVGLHAPRSLADLRAFIESRSPSEAEGVVLRLPGRTHTNGFRRVKVKSSAYVAAHGLSSEAGASPRNLLRVILGGRWDDVGPLLRPHLRERGEEMVDALARWSKGIDYAAGMLKAEHGKDRKAYAVAVQEGNLPIGVMMALWTGATANARAWIDSRAKDGDWGDAFLDNLAGELASV